MTERLDVGRYLARIGYDGPKAPTLDVLRELQRCHAAAIPFETLATLTGDPIRLDLPSLQTKVIYEGRGGYCYELNLLFLELLRALGFDARPLTARVTMDGPEDALTARTHMLILVTVDSVRYTADVGFGGLTPTGPLRLDTEAEQATPHEPYRLSRRAASYTLHALVRGAWRHFYTFDLTPPAPIDLEVASWYVSTHPQSPFYRRLVAARAEPGRRHALRGGDYAVHRTGGETERTALADAEAVIALLRDAFRIEVPGDPRIRTAVSEMLSGR